MKRKVILIEILGVYKMKTQFAGMLALVVSLLLAGCSGAPTKDEGPGSEADRGAGVEIHGVGERRGVGEEMTDEGERRGRDSAHGPGAWASYSLDDPDSPLATRIILFEFDSSDIRSDYVDVLRAHGAYLAANPSVYVTLEGHADERGTREYNLALGERRAHAVKQFLMAEGAGNDQLREISYGEERPVDPGQSEEAWAHNRRVELVY